jgi:hypothetical protein
MPRKVFITSLAILVVAAIARLFADAAAELREKQTVNKKCTGHLYFARPFSVRAKKGCKL